MAGTLHGIRRLGSAEDEQHCQRQYPLQTARPRPRPRPRLKASSFRDRSCGTLDPTLKHKVAKESSWRDPPWVAQKLAPTRVARPAELCHKNASAPLQDADATGPLPQDEGAAFVALLRTCAKSKDLCRGAFLHDDITQRGLLDRCADSLVTMYAKCGALSQAKALLDRHKSMDVITWTALISGYAQAGQGQNALDCYECMQRQGITPNAVTYACALKACASVGAADKGKQMHDEIVRQGFLRNNVMLRTALVDMYAKCGALAKAQLVHEELLSPDVVSWNALISGYAQKGLAKQALSCFDRMQQENVPPNVVTYICILKACSTLGNTEKGRQVHEAIESQGYLQGDNVMLGTALVDMYAKCGALSKAQQVLEELPSRNIVSWSALITGYAQEGQAEQALSCFERMQDEGIPPNAVTYASILKACGSKGAVHKGQQIHDEIVRCGVLENNVVLGTALVDMYAKCGALLEAQHGLEELPFRDVIAWSALIAGYAEEGQGEQALSCFECMQFEGILPNAVTYASVLKACGTVGAADKGKQIHDEIMRQGLLQNNVVLGSALVDMYAKCGAVSKAQCVFDKLPIRNVVSWNALIAGYVEEGQGEQALECFKSMQCEGITPNAVTFVCVLNVCSHLGLVEEGHMLFLSMSTKFGLKPELECYTCMVDLFGRAGHLERAVRFIQEMPSSDYLPIWLALLGACQKWGDVKIGRWAFEHAIQVDRRDASPYVLMANIYGVAGMKESAKSIEAMRIRNRTWEKAGCNWSISLREIAHAF